MQAVPGQVRVRASCAPGSARDPQRAPYRPKWRLVCVIVSCDIHNVGAVNWRKRSILIKMATLCVIVSCDVQNVDAASWRKGYTSKASKGVSHRQNDHLRLGKMSVIARAWLSLKKNFTIWTGANPRIFLEDECSRFEESANIPEHP